MEYKDYYRTLGVDKSASADEIQKAYRKLARKYHPDVNKAPEDEGRFQEINEAYQVLSDPEKRNRYEQFGSAWNTAQSGGAPPPGFEEIFSAFDFGGAGGGFGGGAGGFRTGSGGGFSSFFETLFGGAGPQTHTTWAAGGSPRSAAGVDHETEIVLSLEEAARGGQREIALRGADGSRKVLDVKVPAGIRPDQKIRLAGQGGPGLGGGPRGDLYLKVRLRPHAGLRLDGSDVYTTLPVTPWEAALGGTASVRTLDGNVTVRIPPGSSSGRKIRLTGKGYPVAKGPTGDLFAEIKIVVPVELDDEERRLLEELAEVSSFAPRKD